jgi:hypothetical protein
MCVSKKNKDQVKRSLGDKHVHVRAFPGIILAWKLV